MTEAKRRGRPPLQGGEAMVRVGVLMPPDLRDYARLLGDGEVSAGIRAALQFTMQWKGNNDDDTQDDNRPDVPGQQHSTA